MVERVERVSVVSSNLRPVMSASVRSEEKKMSTRYAWWIMTWLCISMWSWGATFAASQLDIGVIAPSPGTISFAGGSAPLVGTNIEVDEVVGLDTPANNHTVAFLTNAVMNFETGNLTSTGPNNWMFGNGGFFNITGGVDFPDMTPDIPDGTTLLSGTFEVVQVFKLGPFFTVGIAAFADRKHEDLVEFYDMPKGDYLGNMNLSFSTFGNPPTGDAEADPFESVAIFSGDILNTPPVVPTPTAVWMGLSCLALPVVAAIRRRRLMRG